MTLFRGFPLALCALVLTLAGCAPKPDGAAATEPRGAAVEGAYETPLPRAEIQVGFATWYGGKLAGHRTASGERFDPSAMTCAHRTLPLGTWIEVTRVETGESVRVRVNDRGPFGHEDRIIDLSRAAAERIGLVKAGVAKVSLRVVDAP